MSNAIHNSELVQFIDSLNASSGAALTNDPSHWAEIGIFTPDQLGEYLDMEAAHNVYKAEHGHRPHFTSAAEAREYLDAQDHAAKLAEETERWERFQNGH